MIHSLTWCRILIDSVGFIMVVKTRTVDTVVSVEIILGEIFILRIIGQIYRAYLPRPSPRFRIYDLKGSYW